MKRNYLVLTLVVLLVGVLACLNVYADKDEHIKIPDKVMAAVNSKFPQADIEEVEMDVEGISCYEIEVEKGDVEFTLTVTPDGTIIEQEQEIDIKDLPEAIRNYIKTALSGAEIEEAKKETEYYEIILKKLDKPKISYEIEMEKDGKEMEIEFSPDGTILEQEQIRDDDDDDHDDDHDHDDDDDDDDDDHDD